MEDDITFQIYDPFVILQKKRLIRFVISTCIYIHNIIHPTTDTYRMSGHRMFYSIVCQATKCVCKNISPMNPMNIKLFPTSCLMPLKQKCTTYQDWLFSIFLCMSFFVLNFSSIFLLFMLLSFYTRDIHCARTDNICVQTLHARCHVFVN